jgi:nucleoid DNA-binding protein
MGDLNEAVRHHLDRVTPEKRRRDAETLLELMTRITGEAPRLWGSIVGFGQYHYKHKSGREGDAPAASFAPPTAATTIYLPDGIGRYELQLKHLGPHTTGVGCIYINDLDTIDLSVLKAIVAESYRTLTRDTYLFRAREGARSQRGLR